MPLARNMFEPSRQLVLLWIMLNKANSKLHSWNSNQQLRMFSQQGPRAPNNSKTSKMVLGQNEPHTNAKDRGGKAVAVGRGTFDRESSLKLQLAILMREAVQTIECSQENNLAAKEVAMCRC
jgi:hypothetical protein